MDDNKPLDGTPVSVAEAAKRLGVSTDAIRKRLNRGTLTGIKHGREWQVLLEVDQPEASDSAPGPAVGDGTVAAFLDRITELAEANARNAAAAAMWQERARSLETRLLALESGNSKENEAVESPRSDDAPASGINTLEESDGAPQSIWRRIRAWYRMESARQTGRG